MFNSIDVTQYYIIPNHLCRVYTIEDFTVYSVYDEMGRNTHFQVDYRGEDEYISQFKINVYRGICPDNIIRPSALWIDSPAVTFNTVEQYHKYMDAFAHVHYIGMIIMETILHNNI